jgi:hypothetical protein
LMSSGNYGGLDFEEVKGLIRWEDYSIEKLSLVYALFFFFELLPRWIIASIGKSFLFKYNSEFIDKYNSLFICVYGFRADSIIPVIFQTQRVFILT